MGKLTFDQKQLKALRKAHDTAFAQAAEDVAAEIKSVDTLPYRTGALEAATEARTVEGKNSTVELVSDVPYAARVYDRTDLSFVRAFNANAGPLWFEPYVRGTRVKVWARMFAERLAALLSGGGDSEA